MNVDISSVDIERTIAEHGVDPRLLKDKSNVRVVVICPECNGRRTVAFLNRRNKCKKCSNGKNAKLSWSNRDIDVVHTDEFLNSLKILRQETIDKLGTDPAKLTIGSTKAIICECPSCGAIREATFRDLMKSIDGICFACTRKKVNEQNKGRTHTDETKRFLSKLHAGKTISDEHKKRIGSSASKRKGKLSPLYGKPAPHGRGKWYVRKDGTKAWMRSSWEYKFAEYLDAKDAIWQGESACFPVTFEYNGEHKEGTYKPDFFTDGTWIEIKGFWRDDAQAKFEAFKEQYPEERITLLMKPELLALGIDL